MAGGTIDPENDTDFFSITLSETTHVIVWAAHKYVYLPYDYERKYHEPIDVDGTLLDSSGNPVTSNLREKGLQPLQMGFYLRDTLAAGTHYLKVVGNPRPNDARTGPYVIWAEEDTEYGDFLDDCTDITTSYSDPLFGCQWHLDNTGQGQGTSGEDINVTDVWAGGNMGEGIVVAVLDDGVDPDHEDLTDNVDKDKSHDYQGEDQLVRPHETHGTQVAGIIAARDNSLGMRGVAPRATIYSYNILADQYTLENAVDALTRNMDTVAVSNNSWTSAQTWRYQRLSGFYDLALEAGVTRGYGGKGIFYVFAAGNDATNWSGYSNHDEYVNYYAVTTVCAVNDQGIRSYYSERGPNLWVCAPSSDDRGLRPDRQRVATTSSYSRYTGDFGGTSSSAPHVAGVAALVRKANEDLTWRDVKLILAASARRADPTDDGWDDNPSSGWHTGALKYGSTTERYSYSHNYGFGVVDAEAAVDLAESWTNLPPMKTAKGASGQVNLAIPDNPSSGDPTSVTSTITMDSYVEFVEFVEVNVDFTHAAYRNLEIELVSPSGAVSILAVPRKTYEFSFKWDGSFRFGSARHLGEAAAGTWTLRLKDWVNGDAGTLKSWNIRILGHGSLPGVPVIESVTSGGTTLSVSWAAPDESGGSTITDYELRYIKTNAGDKSDGNWTMEDAWTLGDLEYTVSGLESGVSYDIQMRAVSSGGNGRWSDTVVATGSETPPAPAIASVAADGHSTLRVTWSAPVYQGSSEITAYDVRYLPSSLTHNLNIRWAVIDDAWTSGNLEHRITGIGSFREHDVQVRAVNASGDGAWSAARTGEPLRIGPSQPRFPSGSPSGSDQAISINWSEPVHSGASSIIAYDIRYIRADGNFTDESNWTLVDNAWTSGTLTYTISGLENWVLYLIEVRAVNSNSDGDWSSRRRATPQGSDPPPAGDPEVTIVADASSVSESQQMTFTLHRSGAPTGSLRVGVRVTETGRIVSSYHTALNLDSGHNTVSLFVTLRNDTVDEDDSVVTAEVLSGSGYTVGTPGSAQSTATDDDHVPVELAWGSNAVAVVEGDGAVTLLAVATTTTKDKMPESGFSFEVVATSSDGTASQPDDYGQLSGRATFTRADFSRVPMGGQQRYQAVKQFPVTIVDDDIDEVIETFTATLVYADPGPPHLTGGNSTATVAISDDELVGNGAPTFGGGSNTKRSVPENSGERTAVGDPVVATDPDNDTLTYRIESQAGGPFTVNSNTGQIRVGRGTNLNYESSRSHEVDLTVEDPGGLTDTIEVEIEITDVNEPPVVTGNDDLEFQENRTGNITRYSASDPERESSSWSVEGVDGSFFSMDSRGYLSFNDPPDFEAGRGNIYELTVVATDTGGLAGEFDVNIAVTNVNEPPTVRGNTDPNVDENSESFLQVYSASDPEGGASIFTWSLSGTDGSDFNISQDGVLTFRNTPDYERPADSGGNNEYLVTVRASDGQYTGMLNVTVTVRDVNEAPVLDGPDTVDDFPENASTSRQVARYTASDPERATVTLSLTGTDSDDFTLASNGVLTFNTSPDYEDQSSYSVTVRAEAGIHTGNSATRKRVTVNLQNVEERGTVTLSAVQPQERTGLTATLDDDDDPTGITWQWYRTSSRGSTGTAITSATFRFYTPVADDMGSYLRAVASYDDGHGTGKTASAVSANRVQAAPPDPEPPVFPVDGNYDRSIRENTRAGTNLGAPVRATDANNDRLTYSTPESDYFEVDASSGQLRTKAELDHEDEDEYTVTVTATDPGGGTGAVTVTITVTDVNEGPEVSGRNSYTVEENQELSGAEFFSTDPEGDSVARWSLSGTDGGDFRINETGVLTFRNTPNYESPSDSNRNNEYLVTVRASDGQYTGMLNVTVTVQDVNEAPEFASSSKSRTSFTYPENSTHALYTYQATDPEGRTITWSVSGTDGGDFDISVTGVLTFADVPDFENPVDANRDNEYLVTVQAQDDGFNFARLEVTVNVTNSAGTEEPTITTTSRPALTFQENGTGAVYSYSANDPQRGIITWSVAGTDARAFTITSDSSGRGVLTFTSPPDFENPTDSNRDNLYEIAVVATDEQGLTDNFDVTVTVANHAESVEPTISTRRPPTTYRENGTATVENFRASDPQRGPITWSGTGTDASAFALSDSGALSFVSPPDFESPSDSDRQNDYELKVVATDEDGHSDSLAFTITVTDVNEGPEITRVGSGPGSVAENYVQTQVLGTYTATDPEDTGAQITLWSTSGMDGGDFVMNEQGELRFRHVPDYEGPADSNRDNVYEVTVRASDGRVYGDFNETITVNDVNEPPEIRSGSKTAFTQNENLTSRLYTYSATDPERSAVTWLVGGTDARFFAIDEQGQFSFDENSPPNYEIPGDSGGDNVYDVTVQVRDDGGNTRSLPVTVTVRDVNEGPEVTSGQSTFAISENQDLPNAVYAGFDPEGGTVTRWNVGGRDGGDFTITQEGVLTFRNLPDYEKPADSNQDNIYELQVRPYDGRYYGSFDVTITVNDVNEPPEIRSGSKTAFTQNENLTSRLYTYSATDPEGASTATWSVDGVDARFFAIDEQGQFSFDENSPPNYEIPGDSGGTTSTT